MLTLLVARRPSKTDPYNSANIISHVVTLSVLLSTAILAFPTDGTADAWITPDRIGIALACMQVSHGRLSH